VHQPQQKHPRLAPLARHVDQHLKEIHLPEIARPAHQRYEDLLLSSLPLPYQLSDQRDPDAHAFTDHTGAGFAVARRTPITTSWSG
jgi:hypothetical protein